MVYNGIEKDRGSPKEALVLRKPGNYVYITDAKDSHFDDHRGW